MELSLAGLLGAMVGSLIGAVNSVAIIAYADGWLRMRHAVRPAGLMPHPVALFVTWWTLPVRVGRIPWLCGRVSAA